MDTVVISFRSHRNLQGWLKHAARGFKSEGELLALVISQAVYSELTESRAAKLLDGLIGGKRAVLGIGDSRVYAVRLPIYMADLVRVVAVARCNKTPSEWCAGVLMAWWQGFRELAEENKGKGDGWLTQYAEEKRARVAELAGVYARKYQKQSADAVRG